MLSTAIFSCLVSYKFSASYSCYNYYNCNYNQALDSDSFNYHKLKRDSRWRWRTFLRRRRRSSLASRWFPMRKTLRVLKSPTPRIKLAPVRFFFLCYGLYTLLLNWEFTRMNELGNILQIHGFRWGLCWRRASTARMCLGILGPSWCPWVGCGVWLVWFSPLRFRSTPTLLLLGFMNMEEQGIFDTEILLDLYMVFSIYLLLNKSTQSTCFLLSSFTPFLFAGRKAYSLTWTLQYVNLFMINVGYIILAGSALKVNGSKICVSLTVLRHKTLLCLILGQFYVFNSELRNWFSERNNKLKYF